MYHSALDRRANEQTQMTRYIVVRANTLLFGVLAATLLLIGVAAWDRFNADQSARGWSQHSYQVLGGIQDLNLALREAESGQRGYLLTGKADYLAPYQAASAASTPCRATCCA